MSSVPISPYFVISPTSYGGRGAFATRHIPEDTLVLSCAAPYSSVVCRKFRKEVCAWCFAWSWEVARKSCWSISMQLASANGTEKGRTNNTNGGGPGAGVWFCEEECRSAWLADGEEVGVERIPAGTRGLVNAALEKCLVTMERTKAKSQKAPDGLLGGAVGGECGHFLRSLDDLGSEGISPTTLEDAWKCAEQLSSSPSASAYGKAVGRLASKARPPIPPTQLSEIELDTARFVLSSLLRKSIKEDSYVRPHTAQPAPHPERSSVPASTSPFHSAGTWSDLLDLQDNALPCTQSRPHVLASSIRVWTFAKYVVYAAIKETKHHPNQTGDLLENLWTSIDTPHDTRMILGREHGNAFGIWDMAPEGEDSEMLGWGLYPFGSYFNHGCSPTLYKKRRGRAMEFYSLKNIREGEELCIEYIDGGEEVTKRRETLRKDWFFDCGCAKCMRELIKPDGSDLSK